MEGANTSFQVHLRVDPDRFASHFNAAQLATGPALAVAGNSPTFLGHPLWEETRVALFKQAVDDRDAAGRSCPCSATNDPWSGWTATGSRPWTSSASTRGRCGAGTGPSTTRPAAAICGSSCGPCPRARP
jgi:hypothetical protein